MRCNYFGIPLLTWQLPFFLGGVLSAERGLHVFNTSILFQASVVWLFPLAVYAYSSNLDMGSEFGSKGLGFAILAKSASTLAKYCIAFWGIAAVVICMRFASMKCVLCTNQLARLGIFSLDVYVIHQMLILRSIDSAPFILLSAFCALSGSLFISYFIIRRFSILKILFLGKSGRG